MNPYYQTIPRISKVDSIDIIVKDLLADRLGLNADKIQNDASFKYDLGVDSLDFVEILSEFEKIFHIKFEDEDMEGFTTVQSLINYIRKNID